MCDIAELLERKRALLDLRRKGRSKLSKENPPDGLRISVPPLSAAHNLLILWRFSQKSSLDIAARSQGAACRSNKLHAVHGVRSSRCRCLYCLACVPN
jgi:hypothetical protein